MSKYFMIRNATTGLYSSGGSYPTWTAKGKRWNRRGFITSHMSNSTGYRNAAEFYKDAVIVEFEYEPIEVGTTPMREFIERKLNEKEDAHQKSVDSVEKAKYKEAKAIVDKYEQGKNPMT